MRLYLRRPDFQLGDPEAFLMALIAEMEKLRFSLLRSCSDCDMPLISAATDYPACQ